MNKYILACNWKMNPDNLTQVQTLINEYQKISLQSDNLEFITFPPSLYLGHFAKTSLKFGNQDVSEHVIGAFTGELSVGMIRDLNAGYVLVGHSETRKNFGYTNQNIGSKFKIAITNDVNPIICVGYDEDASNTNIDLQQILDQIIACLVSLSDIQKYDGKFMIAYEPVWAIGSGKTPTNEMIFETTKAIKDFLQENYALKNVPVLYGGSVNAKNISELKQIKNLDGFLVGGASLKIEEIGAMAENLNSL